METDKVLFLVYSGAKYVIQVIIERMMRDTLSTGHKDKTKKKTCEFS